MTVTTVLIIILLLMLIGALPVYPHSRAWGYSPALILLIFLILLILSGSL